MSLGPVMVDIQGLELSSEDREVLRHPAAGGVILFSRNFESPSQLERLTADIHRLREPGLLIAVDQEGGRVQRFRDGFTTLPPAAWLGQLHRANPANGRRAAEKLGWLMAAELRASGVDFSFAPVLDLGKGVSRVIGDRAFAGAPAVVAELAQSWMRGVHAAGMAAVGKHFPGHGSVAEDSHETLPHDDRRLEDIWTDDLLPFQRMIDYGVEAVMPAHVVYPRVDRHPAGFSRFWLRDVLRGRLGFQGVIFSDDLSMGAADAAGEPEARAHLALEAGCDMVLVCNDRTSAVRALEALRDYNDPASHVRMLRMHGRHAVTRAEVHLDGAWKEALQVVAAYEDAPTLSLEL